MKYNIKLLVAILVLIITNTSCKFKSKDNKEVAVEVNENTNLMDDAVLDDLLKKYTASFEKIELESEDGTITTEQKEQILKYCAKSLDYAEKIIEHIENYKRKNKNSLSEDCLLEVNKLQEAYHKLPEAIQGFESLIVDKPNTDNALVLINSVVFGNFAMQALNVQMGCSINVEVKE